MADIEIIQPIPRQDSVLLIEESDFVEGGYNGAANKQAIALLNNIAYILERTYAKTDIDDIAADLRDMISAAEKGLIFYETEGELLSSFPPEGTNIAAQALDTRSIYLWKIVSAEDVEPVSWGWVNTGLSDYDRVMTYLNELSSIEKNSTVYFPFVSFPRNNVAKSITSYNDTFLKKFVLSVSVNGANKDKFYRVQKVSRPDHETTPNLWVFEVLNKENFATSETSEKTISAVFPIIPGSGIQTFTAQDGDLFISVTVDTNNVQSGNFYSVTPENLSYTYVIDPSCYIYSGVMKEDLSNIVEKIDSIDVLTKNKTVYFPFSSMPRNNVSKSATAGHDSLLKNFILSSKVVGAEVNKIYRLQKMSIPTHETTPNLWVFEVLNKENFATSETSEKTISAVFPIISGSGIQTFTAQDGDLFISVTVDTDEILPGNFYSVTPENLSYTYVIDPSCYIYSSVKISEIKEDISKLSNPKQLNDLLKDLRNPIQSVCINLIGDSITWGLGASGIGQTSPNNKDYNDIRNTATSRTWANLLRDYLGTAFCTSSLLGEDSITVDGLAYYTNSGVSAITTNLDYFNFYNANSKKTFSVDEVAVFSGFSASAGSGSYINLISPLLTSDAQNRPTEMFFNFVGDSFTINYAKLAFGDDASARAEVYVNDVLHDSFSVYASSAAFGKTHTVLNLPNGKNKIKIVNAGTLPGIVVRISSISATRKITVINNGLSGSSTKTWIDNDVIKYAVTDKDNYIFMQLGTNDRHQTALLGTFRSQYLKILDQIKNINPSVGVVLMAPSAVTQNESPTETLYKFRISDVNDVVRNIAEQLNFCFISNYEKTNLLKAKGTLFLSDNLHPNDFGHDFIAENIINNILGS